METTSGEEGEPPLDPPMAMSYISVHKIRKYAVYNRQTAACIHLSSTLHEVA